MRFWMGAAVAVAAVTPSIVAGPAFAVAPSPIAGYVDIGGGFGTGYTNYTDGGSPDGSDNWNEGVLRGAGRIAFGVMPNMTVQLDAWFNSWAGTATETYSTGYSFTDPNGGVGAHFNLAQPDRRLVRSAGFGR